MVGNLSRRVALQSQEQDTHSDGYRTLVWQRTLREKVSCTGVGLHSGQPIRLELLPAPQHHGIVFVRTDTLEQVEIKASVEHVVDTTLATTLGVRGHDGRLITINTVEHILSALAGMGIDNVRILVDGPEIPIMDGSCGPFVEMVLTAGVEQQRAVRRYIAITQDVRVEEGGDKYAEFSPYKHGLRIACSIDFQHPLISPTPFHCDVSPSTFAKEIANARTFGFLKDVEALRSRGLAQGGSLENAIVIDGYRLLNEDGLRYSNEFVRHKVLDTIGDLALFGMPVLGKVKLHRSGHALNTKLVRTVLSNPKAYQVFVPRVAGVEAALSNDGKPQRKSSNMLRGMEPVKNTA